MRTVGTLRWDVGVWSIECEPHAMIRLKRLFERIDKREHGIATLTDTPENAHELRWFTLGFPLEMDVAVRDRLEVRAAEYRRDQEALEQILAESFEPRAFELALPLRAYQGQAVELGLRSGALLVADDVGLGKTATAIGLISEATARPALVVTLTHLQRQWAAEISKFAPGLVVHTLKKGTPYDLRPKAARKPGLFPEAGTPDVIVSTYHKLHGWSGTLAKFVKSVTFDEVQELRRRESQKYSAAHHIAGAARYRLGLSATPIYNYGSEMYAVLSAMSPGVLGSREEFHREWCGGDLDEKARIKEPRAFGRYLRERGLMIRRTRSDVGRELPALSRVPYEVDFDESELDQVRGEAERLAEIILDSAETPLERMKAGGQLDYRLRRATGLSKAHAVAAFVRLLVEGGERVVLYGWHHDVYGEWSRHLRDLRPAFYTGKESEAAKHASVERFVSGDTPLLVLSLRAGAGLDGLQAVSRTVVFGELDWSPGVHEQCIGRVHRDGQTEPVVAYFLLSEGGSDPIVADVLQIKRAQSDALRDPDADLVERLQVDESHVKRLAEQYLASKRERAA